MISLGWRRLLIVLSVVWAVFACVVVLDERTRISELNVDDRWRYHNFWEAELQLDKSRPLTLIEIVESRALAPDIQPKWTKVGLFLSIPLVMLWVFAFTVSWVSMGFRKAKE